MSVIDEIKERLDIVEVISPYVPLKKAGRSYKGLCPFHNEKTPSFVVFPDTQGWHCFGACGIGGDIFSFVMKRENLDFGEALALLAAKAGVELKPRSEAETASDARLDRLRAIIGDAATYFHYLLMRAGEAGIARDYLARRSLTEGTWEAWQLGYSLDSWDALRDRLMGKGYTLDEIEEAGLIIRREDGSGYHDRFRGRLMIPIRDGLGRTIGFGARILREDPARPAPKYINSPQSPLFDKGSVLFGLDMARKALRDEDLAVLVEGYMDVIGSHQVGVCNVVAGMGTALTEAQMRQIKRYTNNLTLALDPDVAGDHATLRGLETARQSLERETEPVFTPTGLVRQESRLKAQIRIAALPDGLDPDELALRDIERWRAVIAGAKPIVDYYLAIVGREEDLATARGKANAVERMAPIIREIANPVERQHYLQALARLTQSDERLVAEQIATLGRATDRAAAVKAGAAEARKPPAGSRAEAATPRRAVSAQTQFGLEEHLLGWLFQRPDLMSDLDAEMIGQQAPPLAPEDLESAENRALLSSLLATNPADEAMTTADRLTALPDVLWERGQAIVAEVQRKPMLTDEKLIKDLGDTILRLRQRNLRRQVQQVEHLIREGPEGATGEQARALHELMLTYTAQKRQIQRLLNTRSMTGALNQRKATAVMGGERIQNQ